MTTPVGHVVIMAQEAHEEKQTLMTAGQVTRSKVSYWIDWMTEWICSPATCHPSVLGTIALPIIPSYQAL